MTRIPLSRSKGQRSPRRGRGHIVAASQKFPTACTGMMLSAGSGNMYRRMVPPSAQLVIFLFVTVFFPLLFIKIICSVHCVFQRGCRSGRTSDFVGIRRITADWRCYECRAKDSGCRISFSTTGKTTAAAAAAPPTTTTFSFCLTSLYSGITPCSTRSFEGRARRTFGDAQCLF